MKKRLFAILMSICIIFPMLPAVALAEDTPGMADNVLEQQAQSLSELAGIQTLSIGDFTGNGTSSIPYEIATAEQLARMAELVNDASTNAAYGGTDVYYILTADIDLSGYQTGTGWTPIGNASTPFRGIFNGNNHSISNLKIDSNTSCQGLFGYTSGVDIRNLHVENVNVKGTYYVGGLLGWVESGSITDCGASGTVNGSYKVGGLIGAASDSGPIANCYSTGSVNGPDSVGGLIGAVSNTGPITTCYAASTVDGSDSVGGLIGQGSDSGPFTNCYATGSVGGSRYIGGLMGRAMNSNPIANCYSTGGVDGSDYVGGLVGLADSVALQNSAALNPSIKGNQEVGRVTSWNFTAPLTNNHAFAEMSGGGNDKTASGLDGADATMEHIASADWWKTTLSFDSSIWELADRKIPTLKNFNPQSDVIPAHLRPFSGGSGTSGDPYQIGTAKQLAKLAELVNDTGTNGAYGGTGVYYILTADIDLSGYQTGTGWTPIGNASNPFNGTFDGNHHKISNLKIDSGADYQGLFGSVSEANIKNLGVENASVKGADFVGGLAGYLFNSTIINCYATGSVHGSEYVGGLLGGVDSGTFTNCYATISVDGSKSVGGLLGYASLGPITNCYATGSVHGSDSVGGLLGGTNLNTIANCYATGSVHGTKDVGGLLGWNVAASLQNSAALNPSVNGTNHVGRVTGQNIYGPLTNNHAFAEMTGGGTDKTASGLDGADAGREDINSADWWITVLSFDPTVWTIADNGLPGLDNSTVPLPDYLKLQYALTVNGGTGGGSYIEGHAVTVTADAPPTGKQFREWSISPAVTLTDNTDLTSKTVKFKMPAQAVTATAAFEEIPSHTHSYGDWKSDTDAHWKECTAGDSIIGKAAHTAGDWIIDKEASEDKAGSRHTECSICKYVLETKTIAPTGSKYTWRSLTDAGTSITVSGYFTVNAVLNTSSRLHEEGSCGVCDDFRVRKDNGGLILFYDIALASGDYTGDVEVSIPVDSAYNGQTVYFLHCNENVLESRTLTVLNGTVTASFSGLSPFAVANVSGETVITSPPAVTDTPSSSTSPSAVNDTANQGTVPQSGDTADPRACLLMMLAALTAGGSLLWKKRTHKERL